MKDETKSKIFAVVAWLLAITVFLVCCTDFSGGSSGGSGGGHSAVCGSCGRSFNSGDIGGNYKSIAKTGMCKNCYNNFKSLK